MSRFSTMNGSSSLSNLSSWSTVMTSREGSSTSGVYNMSSLFPTAALRGESHTSGSRTFSGSAVSSSSPVSLCCLGMDSGFGVRSMTGHAVFKAVQYHTGSRANSRSSQTLLRRSQSSLPSSSVGAVTMARARSEMICWPGLKARLLCRTLPFTGCQHNLSTFPCLLFSRSSSLPMPFFQRSSGLGGSSANCSSNDVVISYSSSKKSSSPSSSDSS
mmetsp:Transcript_6727/g.11585  ORF Transcript_6727/g.11585 Transcript_6727/m.11585 type:complete len:216 (+) Transcript_6727:538-1185(+)